MVTFRDCIVVILKRRHGTLYRAHEAANQQAYELADSVVGWKLGFHIAFFCDALRMILSQPDEESLFFDAAKVFCDKTHPHLMERLNSVRFDAPEYRHACDALTRKTGDLSLETVKALELALSKLVETEAPASTNEQPPSGSAGTEDEDSFPMKPDCPDGILADKHDKLWDAVIQISPKKEWFQNGDIRGITFNADYVKKWLSILCDNNKGCLIKRGDSSRQTAYRLRIPKDS